MLEFFLRLPIYLSIYPGIPGVSKEAVKYVQERLLLDLSEEEASARFSQLISESMSSFSTQVTVYLSAYLSIYI